MTLIGQIWLFVLFLIIFGNIYNFNINTMANETLNEWIYIKYILNDELYKNNKVIVERQKSENKRVQKLLKNASKGGRGEGKPDFIVQFIDNPNLIIVVECKASPKFQKSHSGDKYKDYAVDGALLYSSFLSKEFDVISIGMSGENERELLVDHYLQLKNTQTAYELKLEGFLKLKDYLKAYKNDERKFNQNFTELLNYSKSLNEKLHALKIKESQRSLFISGSLIALRNKAFYASYLSETTSLALAKRMLTVIKEEMETRQEENIEAIITGFSFITNNENLTTDRKDGKGNPISELKNLLIEIDKKINSFIETYSYVDVLGQFYIEFLRKSNADKSLGIVLTPPHITDLFCDIAQVNKDSVVLDTCTGTGGFLISAMKKMILDAIDDPEKKEEIKSNQIIGIEFDHSIFSLVCSNMFIHGDGRSNLIKGNCFSDNVKTKVKEYHPNVGFLNPPYKSQEKTDTEELEFIRNNLSMLEKNSLCVAIVPMSCAIGADATTVGLKEILLKNHTLEAVFTMPIELFYNSNVSAPTCIMVFKAGIPHSKNYATYFADWKEDGFYKRKTAGRADYDHNWSKIKSFWLENYLNKIEVKGHSLKKCVKADEEWCWEAYVETDYSTIMEKDFKNTVKDFLIFKIKNDEIS